MTEKTFAQLRQEAEERGIPAAAKLRKANLQQRLYLEGTDLTNATNGRRSLRSEPKSAPVED